MIGIITQNKFQSHFFKITGIKKQGAKKCKVMCYISNTQIQKNLYYYYLFIFVTYNLTFLKFQSLFALFWLMKRGYSTLKLVLINCTYSKT